MKVEVKRALKSYFFCHQKSKKNADKLCMKFSSTSNIVHELDAKKVGILLQRVNKTRFQVVYFLEKYDELSKSVAFGEKLRYFIDQNGPK